MPAIKGRRNGPKKDNVEDTVVQENDDISVEEDVQASKSKGRAVMKKAKATDSKKDEDINEVEEVESIKNGKDEEDATVEKSGAKPRGKAAAKKPATKDSDEVPEEALPSKKASKRGNSAKDSNEEDSVDAVKPKKVGKKEEVLPTRRGGDRAAKKVVAYDSEEKAPARKGRGAKAKNGVSKVGLVPKDDSKKRGRQGKKGKGDTDTDAAMETPDVTETSATTVSVEHCKS